jgi:mRNA interferase MazF
MYNQRDIVLVKFPHTDLSVGKPRPALVVSNSKVHKSGDAILAMITSKDLSGDFAVKFDNSSVETPLKTPKSGSLTNYIYCKKLATIEFRIIYKKISSLKEPTFDKVVKAIIKAIEAE